MCPGIRVARPEQSDRGDAVKPAPFTYYRATSASDAVNMLASVDDDASILAGGQSLVPLMNFRVAQPAHLVDINYVDELDYIRVDDGRPALRAGTRPAPRH